MKKKQVYMVKRTSNKAYRQKTRPVEKCVRIY